MTNQLFNVLAIELARLNQGLPPDEPSFEAIAVYDDEPTLPYIAKLTAGTDEGMFNTEKIIPILQQLEAERLEECSNIWEAIADHEVTPDDIKSHFQELAEAQAEDDRWMAWERQHLDSLAFHWGSYSEGF